MLKLSGDIEKYYLSIPKLLIVTVELLTFYFIAEN
jgi:hypothetical protein